MVGSHDWQLAGLSSWCWLIGPPPLPKTAALLEELKQSLRACSVCRFTTAAAAYWSDVASDGDQELPEVELLSLVPVSPRAARRRQCLPLNQRKSALMLAAALALRLNPAPSSQRSPCLPMNGGTTSTMRLIRAPSMAVKRCRRFGRPLFGLADGQQSFER